ncbi:carbamoyltransferase HypF [Photobacterium aquimaris]|uniref:Carbamoyltransferase HypF n=1 Tax=Photobacterium aquimaris TaxID=512643 RepID=A0A2T3IKF2_9GAMM|nr:MULTISPECIES: carbamoyltransferase HypF [Photobacterium]OBU15649.1 carbamoyltransferase HypF [Photobacterium aquimaris]OBU17328.1 carbamoyltransferase HypF [Photobacterium aquimaris]PSU28796.1 carbamoyltransferase HypF [Photobacterium aquimaris]PSW01606.1 carbamoyltransferase HypF [Photobacterium aquimaris]
MKDNFARKYIHITGIVQGVGFRPFVYQLALQYALVGWVINDSEGVKIEAQGEIENLERFIIALEQQAPPLSRIDDIAVLSLSLWQDYEKTELFSIEKSQHCDSTTVCVSPDQGLCHACKQDIANPASRYYRYPFTNCTHCGPRYSITRALPYDRVTTSMASFALCHDCQQAYENPLDRRYHAQPISCSVCGPWTRFIDYRNNAIADTELTQQVAINQLAQRLQAGAVVAIKGLGGFHLVCDGTNSDAVAQLRQIKHRQQKPLAVMVADIETAQQLVTGDAIEWQALDSQARPIVLMHKSQTINCDVSTVSLADNVAPNVPYLGVMLPYTPLHYLLFTALAEINATAVLVMTSANVSGMPIATEIEQIEQQFFGLIDSVLDHNRPIVHACDDSVVHFAGEKIRTLRMARGYAPYSHFGHKAETITLALGAQQKSTIALALPQQWVLSPYIGDLSNLDTEQRYQQTVADLQQLYQVTAAQIVCDKHPSYYSTAYAEQLISAAEIPVNRLQVQHHHAHILAVMAEFNLTQPVLGFTFDGTGWGDDDTVWGGEVLLASCQDYQRIGHLRPFRLIGGEQAIKQPARLLFAMLLECYVLDDIKAMQLSAFSTWTEAHFNNLYQLWQSGSRSPYTSSIGRLIDAWACLLGLVDKVNYEGQCGLLLEQAAKQNIYHIPLSFQITATGVIDWQPLLAHILPLVSDITDEQRQTWINSLAHSMLMAIAKMIATIAKQYPSHAVVLGGGVFQNRVLVDHIYRQFSEHSQPLYCGEQLPSNDGAIAAGQLWYALHHLSIKSISESQEA